LKQQKNAQENVSSSNHNELDYLTLQEKLEELWKKEKEFLEKLNVDPGTK
jgi:hypothetical protein